MRKKLLIVGAILAGLILIVLGVAAMQPSDFRIVRTGTIGASPAEVFEHVNDFHKWQVWSPWAKLDPNAKVDFGKVESGKGATFTWNGNSEVGEGGMTILESQPAERILLKLEFIRPFAGTNDVEFTFKPEGDKTVVKWDMSGKNNLISKVFCLFMDMDKMVGGDFEKGLANMKSVVEGEKKDGPSKTEAEKDPPKDAPKE